MLEELSEEAPLEDISELDIEEGIEPILLLLFKLILEVELILGEELMLEVLGIEELLDIDMLLFPLLIMLEVLTEDISELDMEEGVEDIEDIKLILLLMLIELGELLFSRAAKPLTLLLLTEARAPNTTATTKL